MSERTTEDAGERQAKRPRERRRDHDFEKRYIYGNYEGYYGYRLPASGPGYHGHGALPLEEDPRLSLLPTGLFAGRKCLDIGCNVGLVPLLLSKRFGARSVLGVDIDDGLIGKARHTLKGYVRTAPSSSGVSEFPHNVSFKTEDFVNGDHLGRSYDVITCLSVTKWVQVNWGDEGLKTLWSKVSDLLVGGGHFVMEPQNWKSYTKRRKFTEAAIGVINGLQILPRDFADYITSHYPLELVQTIDSPIETKGFRRRVFLFRKRETDSPKEKEKEKGSD